MSQNIYIHKVTIKNFRLLADAELVLENKMTLIVGRNNSGKTSFSEVIRRFLEDSSPKFQIEDFSNVSYNNFFEAYKAKIAGLHNHKVRALIPSIELRLFFKYDLDQLNFGPLSDFIIDLDPNCDQALIVARYELRNFAIDQLFADLPTEDISEGAPPVFFKTLRERIPKLFVINLWAEDPGDSTNRKLLNVRVLRNFLKTGFVNAQRGLDDNTSRDSDVLAKILENLFDSAILETEKSSDRNIAEALQDAVRDIQERVDDNFQNELNGLLPTLNTFGYPGLEGPEIKTETRLDVERLLSKHTKVRYAGHHGILLPESYNGLGMRNLIFILLQIVSFYRSFRVEFPLTGVHLVFIEEPEAHLHPQMQEVFIRQVSKIADQLSNQDDRAWPVQFVVSTHSSHVANAADFEAIRYFLPTSNNSNVRQTKIKDLREGLSKTPEHNRKFLHQYLTLTRCDLFFADKAALIEGTSERLLLPMIIKKLEEAEPQIKLSSQYMTTMVVGGAYAHLFFELLDFLELKTLIITDLDSISTTDNAACPVHKGNRTSNACLKTWFDDNYISLETLLLKDDEAKVKGGRRIAYQRPEIQEGPCGRTFEDAFMLTNSELFNIDAPTPDEQALCAWHKLDRLRKKTEFALTYAIDETNWVAPGYILDGLKWLADDSV